MAISSRNTLLAALVFIAFQVQAVNVTVAYQTSAEPAKVAQADNTFAKESGAWFFRMKGCCRGVMW